MKHYEVFKRGDRYRIAAPSRFRWNWFHEYGMYGSKWIYETANRVIAQAEADKQNSKERRKFEYSQDYWRPVGKETK